jgi:hypothetical protein
MEHISDLGLFLKENRNDVNKYNKNILHKKVNNLLDLSNLSGTYILISNNTFVLPNSNIEFKIFKRKKTDRFKTKEYLELFENKKFKNYISNLYFISSRNNKIEYKFDYRFVYYRLIIDFNKRVVVIELI